MIPIKLLNNLSPLSVLMCLLQIQKKDFYGSSGIYPAAASVGTNRRANLKFESPEAACKRIVKKEVGLDIDVIEFLGLSEFRDENHFISLNFKATLKDNHQKMIINKNEVSGYLYSYDLPLGTADQYIDIYQKLRRQTHEE